MAGDTFGPGAGAVVTRLGRLLLVGGLGAGVAVASLVVAVPQGRAASHEITISDYGYEPAELIVSVGEPVTWTNTSSAGHTVTSDDGTLDSGMIVYAGAYAHVFELPGRFVYHCALHEGEMTGIIVVAAKPLTPGPSGSPGPTPPPGTLPPNFSPVPTTRPAPTPIATPAPTSSPTPSPSAGPAAAGGSDGGIGGIIGAGLVVIVVGGVTTYIVRRSARRKGRRPG